jgi:DNA gyrase subunit A
MLITSEGTIIRTEISSIRICGRASQGVIVMRTIEGEKVIGIASTPPEDNHDEDENGEASGEQKAYEQDNEEE